VASGGTGSATVKVPRERKPISKKKLGIIAAIVLLICAGAAFAFLRPRDRGAEMAALREKMRDPNLSDDDRRALRDQMRSLWDQGGGRFRGGPPRDFGGFGRRGRSDADIKKILAMSPADQIKELDKDIDDMLKREKQRQADAAKNGNANNQNGGGPRGGGGGPGGPNQSTARRDRMLSSVPAEARADRTISRELHQAYNEMMQGRASQRGITLSGGGGWGGGGGRGGRGG
jgi:hypothetical protein